jgi:hypothetical protein
MRVGCSIASTNADAAVKVDWAPWAGLGATLLGTSPRPGCVWNLERVADSGGDVVRPEVDTQPTGDANARSLQRHASGRSSSPDQSSVSARG